MGHLVGQPSHPEHFAGLSITQNSLHHSVSLLHSTTQHERAKSTRFYNLHLLREPS
jgi:hypothetical protein